MSEDECDYKPDRVEDFGSANPRVRITQVSISFASGCLWASFSAPMITGTSNKACPEAGWAVGYKPGQSSEYRCRCLLPQGASRHALVFWALGRAPESRFMPEQACDYKFDEIRGQIRNSRYFKAVLPRKRCLLEEPKIARMRCP